MKTQTTDRLFVSINQAASLTGLSRGFIRQGCRDKIFPCIRIGENDRNSKYQIDYPKFLKILDTMTGGGENV